jgi:hypothetical protein
MQNREELSQKGHDKSQKLREGEKISFSEEGAESILFVEKKKPWFH